jgi:hypothetical protein
VQSGTLALIPPLDAMLVTTPYWYSNPRSFLADFSAANPHAVRWPRSAAPSRRFLLLQSGGGVEDLTLQVLVPDVGPVAAWLPPREADDVPLPDPRLLEIPSELRRRVFDLAEAAGLPGKSAVHWTCGWLDGHVDLPPFLGPGIMRVPAG